VFGDDGALTDVRFVAPEQVEPIADCLSAMGYADSDIQRILGLNLLRLASIWKV
jgi:hypothetical protein